MSSYAPSQIPTRRILRVPKIKTRQLSKAFLWSFYKIKRVVLKSVSMLIETCCRCLAHCRIPTLSHFIASLIGGFFVTKIFLFNRSLQSTIYNWFTSSYGRFTWHDKSEVRTITKQKVLNKYSALFKNINYTIWVNCTLQAKWYVHIYKLFAYETEQLRELCM
jgi:hypothetical protein